MTDKEKARAYDKALERAKNLYAGVHKGCKEVIDNIFPELRESEDERIRKALIDGVRQIRCKNGITQEQMLAWLEKQKEQKPVEWSEEEIENINAICSYLDNYCWLNARDGYGVEECKVRKEWLKSLPNRFNLPAEQEWSGEDEAMRDNILRCPVE